MSSHLYGKGLLKNSKTLIVGLTLLIISVPYLPFAFQFFFQDPYEIQGGYLVFAVTTEDDLNLMSWMRDNLPENAVILINPQESGTFIPSVSQRKIILPPIASWHSLSYRRLAGLIEGGTLNRTAYNLMKDFNVTYVFIGGETTSTDESKHKWNPNLFFQSTNFELVKKIGDTYLFKISPQFVVAASTTANSTQPNKQFWEYDT